MAASKLRRFLATKLFTAARWKQIQRKFDFENSYRAAHYFEQWAKGNRFICEPAKQFSMEDVGKMTSVYKEQIIRLLSYVHAEVIKTELGLDSPVLWPQDLQNAPVIPLPRFDVEENEEDEEDIFCAMQHPAEVSVLSESTRLQWLLGDIPFQLERRPSPCTPAGLDRGVYLHGHAVPGQVVAFYPGHVYDVTMRHMLQSLTSDKSKPALMSMDAEHFVDATGYTAGKLMGISSLQWHPFALGHCINHPVPGVHPNVFKVTVPLTDAVPLHLLKMVPNRWHTQPNKSFYALFGGNEKLALSTLVLVANRHIHDEELFMDYRYNPLLPYPSWYLPYDDKANRRSFGLSPYSSDHS